MIDGLWVLILTGAMFIWSPTNVVLVVVLVSGTSLVLKAIIVMYLYVGHGDF